MFLRRNRMMNELKRQKNIEELKTAIEKGKCMEALQ